MSNYFPILPVAIEDLRSVAFIHQAAFPDSALTALGHQAICRYYKWQLTGPHDSVCLSARKDGLLTGYCFAGLFNGALSGFVRENSLFLSFLVMTRPWLIRNPLFRDRLSLGIRVMRRLVHKRRPAGGTSRKLISRSSFGILSLAVHPEFQGCGVGSLLMAQLEKATLARGLSEMNLTVNPENIQAIRFYERLGWKRMYQDGSWFGSMMKRLDV